MVNSNMEFAQTQHEIITNNDSRLITKKSLRLSEKKRLVKSKRVEEDEKKAKEEKQRTDNEKKEKEEDAASMELDEDETDPKGKQKRHWESWAKADKDVFFEAVGEFGKDFDKICAFMDKKAKSRGKLVKDYEPRNKDQIRYFYYRTWKQISKAISLQPFESKRLYHEIYCLVCYGELRKKDIRGFGKKDLRKLDELVTNGSTTVRYKGRKIRIKPPTCKFLKKLLDEEGRSSREIESIPESIDVEIYPKSNNAWIAAQCASYNPRIKLSNLPITVKLKSLLKLLNRRLQHDKYGTMPKDSFIALFPPKNFVQKTKMEIVPNDSINSKIKSKQSNISNVKNDIFPDGRTEIIGINNLIPSTNDESAMEETGLVTSKISDGKKLVAVDDINPIPGSFNVTENSSIIIGLSQPEENSKSNEPSSPCSSALENDCTLEKEDSFFPITILDGFDKDLQACYVELNRPNVIRLEYDWQVKEGQNKMNAISSFDKLIMLSQRDLCKMKVISQSRTSATSKPNTTKSSVLPKPNQNMKPPQVLKYRTITTSTGINVTAPLIYSTNPVLSYTEHISPICTIAKAPSTPIFVAQTLTSPSLKNVSRPQTSAAVQRKTGTRLKMIQPASKTLMAKAVAVNFVSQPAQLMQLGHLPPASAQLVNSGAGSVSKVVSEVTSASAESKLKSPSSTMFSEPSCSTLSSPLTIWSSQTVNNVQQGQVQVEVIQEGSGTKSSVKRLHPTAVSVSKDIPKRRRIAETAGNESSSGTASLETDFDLSFLASGSAEDGKMNLSETENVNLSSILSGLTKNLCKDDSANTSVVKETAALATNKTDLCSTMKQTCEPKAVSPSTSSAQVVTTEQQGLPLKVTTAAESITRSVLLTPVRNALQTPTKNDNTSDSLREQPVSFGGQWFSDDITEISLGSLLDVAHLKEGKSSEPTQVAENAVGNLLGDGKKNAAEIRVPNANEAPIGSFLNVASKTKKIKSPVISEPSMLKSFNSDSLIMKPETDPVIAFDSLMDENSIDYINKFKVLTAKFKSESPLKQNSDVEKNQPQVQTSSIASIPKTDANVKASTEAKDPTLPVYRSEDSVGPLDGLSFVLPVDCNSCDSVKSFT